MTLGIVLATAADFGAAEGLAKAARGRGLEVSIFVMDAAVDRLPDLAPLLDEGCEVFACGLSVTRRGVTAPAGVVVGSQDDHAAIVHNSDRLVAFT